MTENERIKDLYRAYWDYMIRKDADGLRKIMTEDYCLRHMTGVQQSREEFRKAPEELAWGLAFPEATRAGP